MNSRTLLLAASSLLLSTACTSKGVNMSREAQLFDERYQQAVKAAMALPDVYRTPCSLMAGGKRDYRYSTCFRDKTGSAADTMQKLHSLLIQAGFKQQSQGNDMGELNAIFTLPNTDYILNTTFSSTGINWTAYQNDRGQVAPRTGLDDSRAPYVLMSPDQFVQIQAMEFLAEAFPKANRSQDRSLLKQCAQSTEQQANICIQKTLSGQQVLNALANLYFFGEQATLTQMNKKPSFTTHGEEAIKALIKAGVFRNGHRSFMTFTKQPGGKYSVLDTYQHPGYRVTYTLIPESKTNYRVKVTAERIAIQVTKP